MKQNKNKLLIFDCDGVLVDSETLVNKVFIECVQKEGFDVDEAYASKHFHGIATRDCITHLEERFQKKMPDGFTDTLSQLTNEEIERNLQPIPRVEQALSQLPYPKCVASGSEYKQLLLSLEVTGLKKYFTHIFSVEEVERGKPNPDLFLFAAEKMHFEPKDCMVIEDSPAGLRAGVAAGMKVFFYCPTQQKEPAPEGVTPFKDMMELPTLIHKQIHA